MKINVLTFALAAMLVSCAVIFASCAAGDAASDDAGTSAASETTAAEETMAGQVSSSDSETPADYVNAKIERGEHIALVDVRGHSEYEQGHIAGAILIPADSIEAGAAFYLPVLDAEIIVCGADGEQSASAAASFTALGYTNVYDMGAFADWTYAVESGEWESKTGTPSSFRANDIYGALYDDSIFAGKKLTMVNVWATYCGACLNEMPDLGKISKAYADKSFQIVGVLADVYSTEPDDLLKYCVKARSIADETGTDYLHLLPSDELSAAIMGNVYALPATLFFDSEGNQIGDVLLGARSESAWLEIIDEYLEGLD